VFTILPTLIIAAMSLLAAREGESVDLDVLSRDSFCRHVSPLRSMWFSILILKWASAQALPHTRDQGPSDPAWGRRIRRRGAAQEKHAWMVEEFRRRRRGGGRGSGESWVCWAADEIESHGGAGGQ
jgi:hypothetical protein